LNDSREYRIWVNFLNFIKKENHRSIEKLMNIDRYKINLESNDNTDKIPNKTKIESTEKFISQFIYEKLENTKNKNDTINNKYNNINKLDEEFNNLNIKFNFENDKANTKFKEDFILSNKKNIENFNPIFESMNIGSLNENIINKLFGIINLGNSCYVNSVIQILLHCKLFVINLYYNKEKYIRNIYSLCNKLYNICKLINVLKEPDAKNMEVLNNKQLKIPLIDISNFIYHFPNKHPKFNAIEQNDSREFLRIILEDINSELNIAKNKSLYI
jgi:hypothetical protein